MSPQYSQARNSGSGVSKIGDIMLGAHRRLKCMSIAHVKCWIAICAEGTGVE